MLLHTSQKTIYTFMVLILIMPFLSSCVLNKFKQQSQPKDPFQQYRAIPVANAWKTSARVLYMSPEDVNVSLHPERRHGPTGFIASGHDKRQHVQGVFSGVCESIMTINVTLKDWRTFDYAGYEQSGNSKLLPIDHTLTAMRDVLKVQCPELTGFKVTAAILYKQVPQFEGHMLSSNDWQLEKGLPKSGFGDDYRVNIKMSTSFAGSDGLIVLHHAKCEKKPSLLITRHFFNETQRAFPQKLFVKDFYQIANAVTKQYINECKNTEIIRFRIDKGILPSGYECNKPNECIVTRKDQAWSVPANAIGRRAPDAPRDKLCLTKNFCNYKGGDILNTIYEGDFAHFQKLDLEYTKGYDDFLKSLQTGNPILDNMYKRKSIIHSVINEYMFQYKSTSASCLRNQFKTLVFKRRASDIVLENMYGVEVHRISGVNFASSYTVNKEFVATCQKVGSAVGGSSLLHETGDAWFNKGMRTEVLQGIKEMMSKEPCNSKQIQQFEKNLLSFYRRIYG